MLAKNKPEPFQRIMIQTHLSYKQHLSRRTTARKAPILHRPCVPVYLVPCSTCFCMQHTRWRRRWEQAGRALLDLLMLARCRTRLPCLSCSTLLLIIAQQTSLRNCRHIETCSRYNCPANINMNTQKFSYYFDHFLSRWPNRQNHSQKVFPIHHSCKHVHHYTDHQSPGISCVQISLSSTNPASMNFMTPFTFTLPL